MIYAHPHHYPPLNSSRNFKELDGFARISREYQMGYKYLLERFYVFMLQRSYEASRTRSVCLLIAAPSYLPIASPSCLPIASPSCLSSKVCSTHLSKKFQKLSMHLLTVYLFNQVFRAWLSSATLRFFSLAEQSHTQKFYLRCFKSDFDAVKGKFDLLNEQIEMATSK